MASIAYTEIATVIGRQKVFSLRLDVLFDNFIRYIARTSGKIAACPQMLAPKLLVQFAKLNQQQAASASFQALHEFTNSQIGRYGDEQMDVIRRHMTAFDDHLQRCTGLADE